jgi:hypothetical protein
MDGRLDTLDIALHLTTIGPAQPDRPSHRTAFHKGHAVEDRGLRRERDHAQLVVLEAVVDPHQRSFPVELGRQCQLNPVLRKVRCILVRVELESHPLL